MLKIRTFPKKSLKWWYDHMDAIDFDPDFQRTSQVWREKDRSFLIDSILNGFDIPKLYIADFTLQNIPALNPKGLDYAIIDGKQRLSAIRAFFQSKLRLSSTFRLGSATDLAMGGLSYAELVRDHKAVAKRLRQFKLDVKSIETNDRRDINDVFLRLNSAAKALNGAEVRNAMIGKAVEAIRDLAKHKFFVRRIRFGTERSQERNAAAKVLFLEYEGGPAETKKKNLDAFVLSIGEVPSARLKKAVGRTKDVLKAMLQVFQDHDRLLTNQGHVPLYYLFIKQLKVSDRSKARAFLEAFEKLRKKNRRAKLEIGDLDRFDVNNRNTNDKQSYAVRLGVMRKRFAKWKAGTA
jgi:hypothetical protein